MINTIPNPESFKEKDFEFAPASLKKSEADEYIRQINEGTEYHADYCGTNKLIETSIIVGFEKKCWYTNVIED